MADNVQYAEPQTPPTGYTLRPVGVDTCTVNGVAGVMVPLGKVGFGGNDTFTYVTSSVGLPVNLLNTTVAVTAGSLPLPTGAATATNQATANTSLSSIDGKMVACDTAHVTITGALPSLAAGTNVIGHVIVDTAPTTTVTGTVTANLGTIAGVATAAKQPALGTAGAASADVLSIQGIASMTALTVAGTVTANLGTLNGAALDATLTGGNLKAAPVAATTGGATPYKYIAAASANQDSQVVKASAGTLYGFGLGNTSAASRYVKFYDKATAPTSADTPVYSAFIPAGGGSNKHFPVGIAFAAGIGHRITTGLADNDAGAATAGDVVINCNYK